MKRTIVLVSCLVIVSSLGMAQGPEALVETFTERSAGQIDPAERARQRQMLFSWLMQNRVQAGLDAPLIFRIPSEEIPRDEPEPDRSRQRIRVGLTQPVGIDMVFPARPGTRPRFAVRTPFGSVGGSKTGGYVWTSRIRSEEAQGIRLFLTDFYMPPGSGLYVYSPRGEVFGPYMGDGPTETGEFWTNTIFGDEVILQLHFVPQRDASFDQPHFTISEIGHLDVAFQNHGSAGQGCHDGAGDDCLFNVNCISDVPATVDPARSAVAHILFASRGSLFICSGGLLTDTDDTTTKPHFLTANHCISKGREANSMEAFFQYAVPCTAACTSPDNSLRTLGAGILATNRNSDYTLMLLDEDPPAGSAFLGWSNAPIASSNGTALARISHPLGLPQAYSEQSVDTAKVTCSSWPRGDWIYSKDTFAGTDGGSSGSPVLNLQGQVVGQLTGACGFNVGNACDAENNATVDGAFAAYFDAVRMWLDPDGGGGGDPPGCSLGQPGDPCSSPDECCSGKCKGRRGRQTCR